MSHSSRLSMCLFALTIACGDKSTDLTGAEACEPSATTDCTESSDATSDATENSGDTSTPSADASDNGTASETVRLLPMACFIGPSACDPRNGEGCGEGSACDFSGDGELMCFPPPNTAAIDEACNNAEGPFCASGGWCAPDSVTGDALCHKVCCSDSECTEPGFECVGVFTDPNIGSLGLCKIPTEGDSGGDDSGSCLPPGASCSMSNDQCCGYCHSGHCH